MQLHKTEEGSQDYAEFLHLPRRRFTDFCIFHIHWFLYLSYLYKFFCFQNFWKCFGCMFDEFVLLPSCLCVQPWFARKFRMKLTEWLGKPNRSLLFLSTSASILQMVSNFIIIIIIIIPLPYYSYVHPTLSKFNSLSILFYYVVANYILFCNLWLKLLIVNI